MSSYILKRGSFEKILSASGSGIFIRDRAGRKYIDSCSGAVASLGYDNERVIEAAIKQMREIPFSHTATFTSDAAENLAELLVTQSKGSLSKVIFTSSGTEAVEVAIKMAAQYWHVKGQIDKKIVLSRELSYHGGSIKTLEIGGQLSRKKYFCEENSGYSENIKICSIYRNSDNFTSTEEYADNCVQSLEDEIIRIGPENISCFLIETVGGSTSGAVTAEKDYFIKISKICKKYNILLVLDEVMCGLGRTGYYYAFEHENIRPDIIAVGKTIASGYQPLGAALCNKEIASSLEELDSGFVHAGTYVGHNVACSAGLAAQEYVLDNDLVNQVNINGKYLNALLKSELKSSNIIGDIRGRGFLQSIELVSDIENKTPFNVRRKVADKIKNIGISNGILLYTCSGFDSKGTSDQILIAPPYISSESELGLIVDKVKVSITKLEEIIYKNKDELLSIA